MPPHHAHEIVKLNGRVADVFAHRFVLETANGRVLADLTPRGMDRLKLREGDEIEIVGERKPSEIKVRRVIRGGKAIEIDDGPPKPDHHAPHHHAEADPEQALRGARAGGFKPVGRPSRRPKHYEILARNEQDDFVELHVDFDGHVRKARSLAPGDPRWDDEMRAFEGAL